MKKESVLALLFALNFLEASDFVTITAMRHPETSLQISGEVFKYPFILRSSLIQANEWDRRCTISYPVKANAFFLTQQSES